ncbi:MAG TPA: hypothetical protein PKN13_09540 [Accumulibacter sp.]|nr:hypothetical protein [Accumulibacter sp.]HMW18074.1 hypothetical protein [Accumulibacter sp.]HNC18144.1 hypothetical protein [Accumulibacter sp.]HND80691.1 hypothetical protein [Accumulibacter sp.]HNE13380.1 hypothetical protein [Accumulibacter sp.]
MDPVVSAVVAALAVLGNTSLDVTLRKATSDAYDGLKNLLKGKFGEKHAASTLIDEIEAQNGSEAIVTEKGPMIAALKLGDDPEVIDAVRRVESATTILPKSVQSRVAHYHGSVYGPTGDHSKAIYHFGVAPDTPTK